MKCVSVVGSKALSVKAPRLSPHNWQQVLREPQTWNNALCGQSKWAHLGVTGLRDSCYQPRAFSWEQSLCLASVPPLHYLSYHMHQSRLTGTDSIVHSSFSVTEMIAVFFLSISLMCCFSTCGLFTFFIYIYHILLKDIKESSGWKSRMTLLISSWCHVVLSFIEMIK